MFPNIRLAWLGLALGILTACSTPAVVDEPAVSMGDFRFGHKIVVVDNPEVGPFSRTVEDSVLQERLTQAMADRFGGYEGEKFYHIGVKMDLYVLALPGVPVVFTPKSVLVLTVNMWDDSTGEKVNAEEKTFTVFEGLSSETVVGSGLMRGKEKQMEVLSNNAAKAIQNWILENPEWVGLPPLPQPEEEAADTDN
jgi:hypothetical protein